MTQALNEFTLPPYVVNEVSPILPQSQTIDWGVLLLKIQEIHAMGVTGKGIRVAVVDTGVDAGHPDLKGTVTKVMNATSEAFASTNSHGTAVAGVIGARNNTTGVLGIAPDVEIIAIKAMRETGSGFTNEINQGIRLAIQEKVHIINLSLGTDAHVPSMKQAIDEAIAAGIIVVCAAGNSGGDDSVNYPARYENTYAVAATNQAGNVSAFSSRGDQVDIAAPGERILTTWKNNTYAKVSGTSFASPAVAAVFALFLQVGINVDHEKIKSTAIDIEEIGKDNKSGYGLINPLKLIVDYKPPIVPPPPVDPPIDVYSKIKEAQRLLGEFLNQVTK